MQPERDAAAAMTPPSDGSRSTNVQHAVEQFVELHSRGEAPDAVSFVAKLSEDIRPRALAQIREFLAFDGLLGHQEWAPSATADTQGRVFGDFVIQEELGRGGMGVVYLAHQKSLNRRVALKVMASGLTLSKRHVERFRREAAAAAQLRHPAIVSVHALAEVDGTFALAMDFVAGRNLGDILDDLRLANGDDHTTVEGTLGLAPEKGYVAECAMFVAQLASALAVAHQAKVVHRDLKPRNLMLDDRRQVRLLDFGLAKSLGEGSISMSGEITGTAHYMSPEQTLAKRVEVDHRADIWALGVILYEVLTLRRPFDGKNLQQVVYEICFKEPVALHRHNHKVPRDLVTICQKALEKDPQNRYQTAAEFEDDLLRFLRWEPVHAKPASAMTRVLKWMRRHRTGTAIASALLLLAMTAVGVQWYRGSVADELLVQAEDHATHGRFAEAIALANEALGLRNDVAGRARLYAINETSKSRVNAATTLTMRSQHEIENNRELAIRLALQAEELHSSLETRSGVLNALGSGSVARTLRAGSLDDKPIQLIATRWSPDSRRIVTVGYSGHIVVWDAATGAPMATLSGHAANKQVVGVAFASNDRLVTTGADMTMRLWRLVDASLERTIALPGVTQAMQPDRTGTRVLVLTHGRPEGPWLAQVYDLANGQAISPAVAHTQTFVAYALSPSGTLAATSSSSTVRMWSVETGIPIELARALPRGRVRALTFSPDSSLLAVASDQAVHLIRTVDGEVVGVVKHSLEVTSCAFDSKGHRLLTGSRDWTARVWQLAPDLVTNPRDPIEIATLLDHKGPVNHVAFDASDQLALTATGGRAGALYVFDVGTDRATTGSAVQRYGVGPSIGSAEFSPDGRAVLALAGTSSAKVWDFGSASGVVRMRQAGRAGACAFDAKGQRLVTGGDDERVRLWSAHDGHLLWETDPLGYPMTRVAVDGAGELIACAGTRDGNVRVLRLLDGAPLYTLEGHDNSVAVVHFQPGSDRLLTAGLRDKTGGRLILWNTNDRSRVMTLDRGKPIHAADITGDGSLLATVEEEESVVRLWAVPSGEPRGEIRGHDQRIGSVRFTGDGKALLTASRDRTARLHDLAGNLLKTLTTEQPLKLATFSPDGQFVLTCSDSANAEALLWRLADGTELVRFRDHRGPVEWGTFHPDGSAVATTAGDGTTCIWPTDPVGVAKRLLPSIPSSSPPTTK